jgi:hypothetical protein
MLKGDDMRGRQHRRLVWTSALGLVVLTSGAHGQCAVDELFAPDGQPFDQLGAAVAVTPGFLVVGAPNHVVPPPPGNPDLQRRGQVYVLARPSEPGGDEWIDEAVLFPASTATFFFGSDVDADSTRVIAGVGTGRHAYIFRRDTTPKGSAWVQERRLDDPSGDCCSNFGLAVAVDGVHAAVADTAFDAGGGIVYVFHFTGDDWVLEDSLTPTSTASPANFGQSLALDGQRLIVGANIRDDRAFVFRHNDGGTPSVHSDDFWEQEAELAAPGQPGFIQFGISVAIQGNRAVIGAPAADNGGAAFVYEGPDPMAVPVTSAVWPHRITLGDPELLPGAGFGWSVAMDRDRIAVGANGDSSQCPPGSPQCAHGAVYHYQLDSQTLEILAVHREVPATTRFAATGTSVAGISGASIPGVDDPTRWLWFAGAPGRSSDRGSVFAATCQTPGGCPGDGACLVENGTPGCQDTVCCTRVCKSRPECCGTEWDMACGDLAIELCDTACCDFTGGCSRRPLQECVTALVASRPANGRDAVLCGGDGNGNGVDDACERIQACCDPSSGGLESCADIDPSRGETCPAGFSPQRLGSFCIGDRDEDQVDDICRVGLDGDMTGDGIVGPADVAAFTDCLAGPGTPLDTLCGTADADADGDGDLLDAALFQITYFAKCRTDKECDDGDLCTARTCHNTTCVSTPTLAAFLCGLDGASCDPPTGDCLPP